MTIKNLRIDAYQIGEGAKSLYTLLIHSSVIDEIVFSQYPFELR